MSQFKETRSADSDRSSTAGLRAWNKPALKRIDALAAESTVLKNKIPGDGPSSHHSS